MSNKKDDCLTVSQLIKKHDLPISAKRFNKALIESGAIVQKFRPSTKQETLLKPYYEITEPWLPFGYNKRDFRGSITPRWYDRHTQIVVDFLYEWKFLIVNKDEK